MDEKFDKEIDEFIDKEIDKDITQTDKIDENVEGHIQEMGWLWERTQQKLSKDNICFGCKSDLSLESKDKIHVVEAGKVEKGVIAFLSICQSCYDKQKKKEVKEVKKNE